MPVKSKVSRRMAKVSDNASRFLRVLIEPKKTDPRVWIATCLETGYVASGVGCQSARDQMLEILRAEWSYALQHNKLNQFFRVIPKSLEDRWEAVTRDNPPKRIRLFEPEEPEGSWPPVDLASVSKAA